MDTSNTRFIEMSALQAFASVNLNRDDNNQPKTSRYGDTVRTRVSSACAGRAIRVGLMDDEQLPTAVRTIKLPKLIAEKLRAMGHGDPTLEVTGTKDADTALIVARWALNLKPVADKDVKNVNNGSAIVMVPANTADLMATALHVHWDQAVASAQTSQTAEVVPDELDEQTGTATVVAEETGKKTKKAKPAPPTRKNPEGDLKKALDSAANSDAAVDIALFGRMTAAMGDKKTEGALQIAHWITVDAQPSVLDFFTAKDDAEPDEDASSHMGHKTLTSGVFLRWMALDRIKLRENLAASFDAETVEILATKAEDQVIRQFVMATPSGNRKSTGSSTLPSVVTVAQTSRPVNPVDQFLMPVNNTGNGSVVNAVERIAAKDKLLAGLSLRHGKAKVLALDLNVKTAIADHDDLYELVDSVEGLTS